MNNYNVTDGTHTNNIEAKWGTSKCNISQTKSRKLYRGGRVMELVWHFQNKDKLWKCFVCAILLVGYDDITEASDYK